MKKLAVVILNWNGQEVLSRCLVSLTPEFDPTDIFVIDNHSTDGSLEAARDQFPLCQFIPLDHNYSFSGGYNRGLPTIIPNYEYILLLNNDTFVEAGLGPSLRNFVSKLPEQVGMVAMKMIRYPSAVIDNLGLTLHASGLAFNSVSVDQTLACPSGGGAVFRSVTLTDMLTSVGYIFDENFHFYVEDLDLGVRARLLGWDCVRYTERQIYHAHGHSMRQQPSSFALWHVQRNQLWMIIKNYPTQWWWKYGLGIVASQLAEVFLHLVTGHAGAVLSAKWATLKGIPSMLNKRRRVQAAWKSHGRHLPQLFSRQSLFSLWRTI